MNKIIISIDEISLNSVVRSIANKVRKAIINTVINLAREGQTYAKSMAPHYAGKMASLIKVMPGSRGERPTSELFAQNPTANDGHSRKDGNFNLVDWMHNGRGSYLNGMKHIKSGRGPYHGATFMTETRKHLKRVARDRAIEQLNIR